MSSRIVCCRLCLAMDVPMHVLENNPLQEVYEKLTNISLTKTHWPVVACYLCYCQLRNSHKLMAKSMRADMVLRQILQSGDVVSEESIAMINREAYQLTNILVVTPVETLEFSGTEDDLATEVIKSEPLEEGEETEFFTHSVEECLKFEEFDIEEERETTDTELDVKMEIIEVKEDFETRISDDVDAASDRLMHEKYTSQQLETAQDMAHDQLQGAVTTKEYKQTHMEIRRTSEKNIIDARTVIGDEVLYGNNDNILHSYNNKRFRKDIPGSSDVATSKNNASVTSDNNCTGTNTNVGSSKPKATSKKDTSVTSNNNCTGTNTNVDSSKPKIFTSEEHDKVDKRESNQEEEHTELCQQINQQSFNKSQLSQVHTEEKSFECEINKTNKSDLSKHLKLHTEEKPYECEICHRSFKLKRALTRHSIVHSEEKPFECDICQHRFNYKGNWSQHLRIHTGGKPHECEICHRKFSTKRILTEHLNIHTLIKPYECELCYRRFNQKGSLRRHFLVHTKEKKFECQICQHKFKHKANLLLHLRIHTGEKPYECEICYLRFNKSSALSHHIKVHTQEKPYECDVCQHRFIQKGNLVQHLKVHTKKQKRKYTLKNK